jgi:hypothetical protein
MRVGAGGLWGGFVWIERGAGRPWVITPEEPQAFVRALSR